MKIYNKLVYNLKTGDVIEESFFEYDGIMVECKGGGGSSSTSVDEAYNKRLATIAEAQQGMAEEYFNYYKYGSGQWGTSRPDTSARAWNEDPEGRARWGEGSYEDWVKQVESDWEGSREWIPEEGAVGLQQLEQEQIKAGMKLLPGQTALAERHMGLTGQYFDEIAKGPNVREEMGRAKTDVHQAYSGMEGEMRREAGRMGINPASGRYAGIQSRMAREKTKGLAGAGTMGRRYAEERYFNRLRGAVGGQ